MLDLVLAFLFALLIGLTILVAIWAALAALGVVAGIEILNGMLTRLGFSRPSPQGHTPGQHHTAEVTRAFRYNPARGVAEGTVRLRGEIWNAECAASLAAELEPGAMAVVVYGDDLRVRVDAPATRRLGAARGSREP